MGTKANKSYDHPDFLVTRISSHTTVAGNGTIGARFRPYINAKLIAVHVQVVTAGTTTDVLNSPVIKIVGVATTVLGTFVLVDSVALTQSSITGLDQTMGLGDEINITNGTDVVGVCDVTYEYRLTPGGTFST